MILSARVLSVEEFFQLGIFVPASVQRDYVWDAQQAEDLLNDIDRACLRQGDEADEDGEIHVSVIDDDGPGEGGQPDTALSPDSDEEEITPGYHLGEVVLRGLDESRFEIFDGLQRVTTLTILMAVIRDLARSEGLRARIHGALAAGETHRISMPGPDRTLLTEILTSGATAKTFRRAVTDRGLRIRRSRTTFQGYLKPWNQVRLSRFGSFLLDCTYLVVAETDSQTLARQVFITSNHRGMVLRPVDIFKGQILDITGAGEAAESFTKSWDAMLQIAGDGLEELMRAYDFICRRSPQGPDHLTKLADHIEKNHGLVGIPNVMRDVNAYASSWLEFKAKLREPPAAVADADIWRLGFFKWFEWKPLALAWYREYRDNRAKTAGGAGAIATKTFRKRFAGLHRACMVITLAKFSAVDRAKIFGNALSQWRARQDPLSARGQKPGALTFRPQHLARAVETLSTPLYDDEIRLPLIRWLESMAKPSVVADTAFASVEHVLPQRPAPGSQWFSDFPDEEERFSACHSIGNLALMDYADNVKITNLDFRLKLPVIKEQAKKYKTLAGIAEKKAWTAAEIRERAAAMIAFACEQLNIPRPPRA